MRRLVFILLASAFIVSGCEFSSPPDPNEPREGRVLGATELRRNLTGTAEMIYERVMTGEIDDKKAQSLIQKYADELIQKVNIRAIPPKTAWEYGEVFLTAKRWEKAKEVLEIAVSNAKGEDRRVNDTLRLARAEAELGQVEEAIKTANSVMDTQPVSSAPILPAVLLEIVPAAEATSKGHEIELAKLLENAIGKHEKTIVDAESKPGRDFLYAKPAHIRNAWLQIEKLYSSVGRSDLADQARERQFEAYAASRGMGH